MSSENPGEAVICGNETIRATNNAVTKVACDLQ
jgi:hypothetical protein